VKSGSRLNVAVAVWLEFTMMLHTFGSFPVQAPLQLEKIELAEGTALRETTVPLKNVAEQVVPQLMDEPD